MGRQGRKGKRRKLAEKLYGLLKKDIIKRYSPTMEPSIPRKSRDHEILMKYNYRENWDDKIITKFQKDNELDDEQIEDIVKMVIVEFMDF